ncbi:VENN motif pre-toxin domain-containing protein [Pantoea eucrina]|uniref:VENN motif pre-toxin domain-containing protein n=1 Tax=Pantoea eucrina TaxID=472693 RepID=UPI0028AFDAAF|nr:VENN motif pre-toxin domain-containing protein [Pantoea eucrina]
MEHQSAGVSTGGSIGGQFAGNMANGLLTGANHSGSGSSLTNAAVSGGALVIRDGDKQSQDVSGLSRDAAHANQTLSPIFDKEREQNRLQAAQLIGEIGNQAADIARAEGQIRATNAGKAELAAKGIREPGEGAPKAEWADYNKALAATDSYKAAAAPFGTGSALQQGIQAATAAVQGLAGGSLAQAVTGAAAPYLAEIIKQTAPDEAGRIMAHAAMAGVIAAAQGNSALSGAAGAATTASVGEAIKKALYGDVPVSQLNEEQKQTLVALGTVAAGLAGGLTGNSTADAVAGAQAGQNEISNNMFSAGMLQQMLAQETLNSAAMAEAGKGGASEQAALALTKKVKEGMDAACLANTSCMLMAVVAAQQNGDSDNSGSTPNVGKDLTDAEKTELAGAGSGTPTPPENDPKQKNDKQPQQLNQKQESAIRKIDNTIKNALKDHYITGTLKDMDGNPVPKQDGGYWGHMQEMQNTLRGLRNHADTLKNLDNPEAQAAYGRATDAINKIESALKGHGI